MSPSVLLIGASGAFGRPLVEEFINQLPKFDKVGILTDPSKISNSQMLPREVFMSSLAPFSIPSHTTGTTR
jgi:hypothetical protein